LNANRAKNLVYVHYNLRLLSHYSDAAGNIFSKRDATWDNNPETNLEDAAMVLEYLEAKLLGDHDGDHGGDTPPLSISNVPDASILPFYLHSIHCHVAAI
jgi:hypothetical protein